MYEFPPSIWYQTPWWPTVSHIGAMVFALGVFAWLLRKKRTPRAYDLALILMTYLTATYFLVGPHERSAFPYRSSHWSAFLGIGLAATFTSVVMYIRYARIADNSGLIAIVEFLGTAFFVIVLFFFPSMGHPREASYRTLCRNNLKVIGLAFHNFHDGNETLPSARSGNPPHSWRVELLPYLERKSTYDEYDFESAWNIGTNRDIAFLEIELYQCPSNDFPRKPDEYPTTAYAALTGNKTFWPNGQGISFRNVPDGISQTILVVEACGRQIPWSEPRDVPVEELTAGINLPGDEPGQSNGWMSSYHAGGTQVLFGDGSVHLLSQEVDNDVLRAFSTRAGGEDVDDF